ncbi:helix-turn-helix transcriptional regulator [Comamonas testosteroni]|uniref:helix-turn-helix transcriptional regulator n=1 Tax=Comamonas testosteroni TaxID=285 RepID=UPI002E158691|nr:LuxR C-terminal-related transcriptional regulator [Comamonas testosteroni]WQD40956.1 LuxR C-terminal-related transcriptional regulator [Comamonas testosteroni]
MGHFWVEINSLAEISERLNCCIKTVSSQKMAAMRKLEAKSNQALMAFCLNSGVFHQRGEIACHGAPN